MTDVVEIARGLPPRLYDQLQAIISLTDADIVDLHDRWALRYLGLIGDVYAAGLHFIKRTELGDQVSRLAVRDYLKEQGPRGEYLRMTDALVEAVARAISLSGSCIAWEDHHFLTRGKHRNTATAALQAIEAAGYRVVSSEGIRQAVDAGLQGFCKEAPDFSMSPKMRQDAVDHILGQPLAALKVA